MRVANGVTVVIGLGVSGQAICRHLARQGTPFMVADTRAEPPGLLAFQNENPGVEVYCGPLSALDLTNANEVVLSPGVDPYSPGLEGLLERYNPATGEPMLVGEIALFVRAVKAPIAAITGSNAKSTVTTLLGEMAKAAGVKAAVGGNLGTPALDLLVECPDAELYILELSSFQLETTPHLAAKAAAFLNICEDHLDRHGDMVGYRRAKQRIFHGAQSAVVNADDPRTWPETAVDHMERFTVSAPTGSDWGLAEANGELTLFHGEVAWLSTEKLAIAGRHNFANALAALAMGNALGFAKMPMCQALTAFKGLPHRSEVIVRMNDVMWVNDSKGTNVGATLAAIQGISATLKGKVILLAGGVGKGADFTPLAMPLAKCAKTAVLFGADAQRLEAALSPTVPVCLVDDLPQAMDMAWEIAEPGDCVLLSPACASLDQFVNYQARGDAFRYWVERKYSQHNHSEERL